MNYAIAVLLILAFAGCVWSLALVIIEAKKSMKHVPIPRDVRKRILE